jgi:hypothetical protein
MRSPVMMRRTRPANRPKRFQEIQRSWQPRRGCRHHESVSIVIGDVCYRGRRVSDSSCGLSAKKGDAEYEFAVCSHSKNAPAWRAGNASMSGM